MNKRTAFFTRYGALYYFYCGKFSTGIIGYDIYWRRFKARAFGNAARQRLKVMFRHI